jgi:hypothetical protein
MRRRHRRAETRCRPGQPPGRRATLVARATLVLRETVAGATLVLRETVARVAPPRAWASSWRRSAGLAGARTGRVAAAPALPVSSTAGSRRRGASRASGPARSSRTPRPRHAGSFRTSNRWSMSARTPSSAPLRSGACGSGGSARWARTECSYTAARARAGRANEPTWSGVWMGRLARGGDPPYGSGVGQVPSVSGSATTRSMGDSGGATSPWSGSWSTTIQESS